MRFEVVENSTNNPIESGNNTRKDCDNFPLYLAAYRVDSRSIIGVAHALVNVIEKQFPSSSPRQTPILDPKLDAGQWFSNK
jgi:hypothetical protein